MAEKLISIEGWIAKRFDRLGAPAPSTVRKWCASGHVPAKKIGSTWYIDQDLEKQQSGNDLVDRVMEAS